MTRKIGRPFAVLILGLSALLGGCGGPEDQMGKILEPDEDEVSADEANPGLADAPSPSVAPPTSTQPAVGQSAAEQSAAVQSPATPPVAAIPAPQPAVQSTPSTPSSNPTSVVPIRPGSQLSVAERRRHAIASLQLIAGALERYRVKNHRYPDCYYHYDDQPYLSWRVELLPLLGYGALYKKFNYREPWDSPSNLRLLAEIPPMYQSPERGDERTNFLLAVGQHTAYVTSSGPRDEVFSDGRENTVLLVEVDDANAVPWTKPDDWRVDPSEPKKGVFGLREDGFFAVMGNAIVRQIPTSISDSQLTSLWTARGSEPVSIAEWSRAPSETVDEKLAAANRAPTVGVSAIASAAATTTAASAAGPPRFSVNSSPAGPTLTSGSGGVLDGPQRSPVPVASEVKSAEALLKQVYGDRYEKSKTQQERRELATAMLGEAESVRHELPSYYSMLRVARDIATKSGDLPSAANAMQRLESAFELNVLEHRLPWLETANKQVTNASDAVLLADQASSLFEIALERDAFQECRDTLAMFQSLARRANDQARIEESQRLKDRLDAARKGYAKVAEYLHTLLREPQDPQANYEVGKYLCFVKRQWENGAAHLARGHDGPLKQAAILELQRPATPEAQAALGDAYWSLADANHFPTDELAIRDRAVFWYRLALPQQPDGLRKALIQERTRVAEELPDKKSRKQT